jgi:excisionase family DNA binding protein
MRLLNVKQLAEILNVKEKTLYHWERQGRLPCIRLGRLVRFDYDTVMKRMEAGLLGTDGNNGRR